MVMRRFKGFDEVVLFGGFEVARDGFERCERRGSCVVGVGGGSVRPLPLLYLGRGVPIKNWKLWCRVAGFT